MVKIKRVYEKPEKDDGVRILVDRLWPRGLSKRRAKVDLWLKDVAPSTMLRRWFKHDEKKWNNFVIRYRLELKDKKKFLNQIAKEEKKAPVTLVYAARDETHNQATVLKDYLEDFHK